MNLVEAYVARQNGTAPNRNPGLQHRYRGRIQITYELLETMLELPQGVRITSIHPNPITDSLDFIIGSEREYEGITYRREEGAVIPNVDMDRFTEFAVHNPPRHRDVEQVLNFNENRQRPIMAQVQIPSVPRRER